MAKGFNWNRVNWQSRIQRQGYESTADDWLAKRQKKKQKKKKTKSKLQQKTYKKPLTGKLFDSPLVFEWDPPRP